MAVSIYPLAIASAFNHSWLGGDISCIYYGLLGLFFGVASIMTLTVMAVVRLILTSTLQITAWKHHKAYQAIKNNEQIPNSNTLEKKLTLMAVMVTAGFLCCWAPYAVISFWSIYNSSDNIPPEISVLPCLLAKSSTVYNPLIYYAFSKIFRREIKELKCCCLCQIQLLNHAAENELRVRWSGRNNVQIQPLSE
ncbi:UNVERIFIED_CONTAM: hypothetical protein FKN15_032140 [Acipenser sinensis]